MPTPTIAEVANMPDGWLNGLYAVVDSIEPKKSGPNAKKPGSPFWVVNLADATGPETAEMVMFGKPPTFSAGACLDITGKGVKKETTQYGMKISIGMETVITVIGQSAHHPEQAAAKASGAPAVNGKPNTVLGQTVGMALKEAITLVSRDLTGDQLAAAMKTKDFWADVKLAASNVIRISKSLEQGHLSPAPWAPALAPSAATPPPASGGRADPPKPAGGRPAAGPGGSVAHDQNLDEDIPF